MDLGIDGQPSFENRADLARHIADTVRKVGYLVTTVERLSNQELADLCWAAQLAGRLLCVPLCTRALTDRPERGIEIRVAPRELAPGFGAGPWSVGF